MFRTLRLGNGVAPVETSGPEAAAPPKENEVLWVDLEEFEDKDLAVLQQCFGFHPLAIEDCANRKQRAKLDDYDGYLFIVVHEIRMGQGGAV